MTIETELSLALDQMRKERDKLKVELSAAYGLIETFQIENQRLRRDFHNLCTDTIKSCNDLLMELKK